MKTSFPAPLARVLALALGVVLFIPSFGTSAAAAVEEPTFTFNGGGWGHGIGLSQYGARGYALQGWTYDQILKHYYQDTRLETKPPVTVRVNLDSDKSARSQWQIQASADTTLTISEPSDSSSSVALRETVAGVPAKYWVTSVGGNTQVQSDSAGAPGAVIKTFSGRCYASSSSPIRIVGKSGPFDHTGVSWRGRLHFIPSTSDTNSLNCVNYLAMEDYLKGVVPRESPSSWPAEALKAQAIAARSYAYDDAVNNRVLWCTTMSQVYNGHSRPGYDHETDSTNAAIAATEGQLVWYGTETAPVKTYFSSSSGGHTANIEDVWFSTPKPYYTGVPDADKDGNPYYTWSSGAIGVVSLSETIRSKVGAAYSAPAPQVIESISLERADSGYTRYADITWTNGMTYRIKGDAVRSALGLKSTKFSVQTQTTTTAYSERNSSLAWSGMWSSASHSSAYGDRYRRTKLPRSQMVARFTGTGVKWFGTKGASYGRASVAIDGVRVATVDLYSAKTLTRRTLYSKTGLPSGEHTLTVTALKSRSKRSSGYGVSVDRISITGGTLLTASAPVQQYEQSGGRVAELGGWSLEATAGVSGGTHVLNTRPDSKIVVDFVGTTVTWLGTKAPGYGAARVSVDGAPAVTVSLDAPSVLPQQPIYSSAPLTARSMHRIVITTIGASGTSNGTVSADRFDITGGWTTPTRLASKRYQETSASRTGSWRTYRNRRASGRTHIVSGTRGASVTIPFEGTTVAWYGARTPQYGKAEVLLDGTRVAVVDLYSRTTQLNRKLWSRSHLPAKGHTLTIRVLDRKRTAATGTLVSVDAFVVAGRLAPTP